MSVRDAVIVSTARTPIGRAYKGAFNATAGATLGALSLHPLSSAQIEAGEIDDVVWGCVLTQGTQSDNIGRQVALRAGCPVTVGAQTIDRQCASGLMAIATAAKQVIIDRMDIVAAGGQDSISLVQTPEMRISGDPSLIAMHKDVYMPMLGHAETGEALRHQPRGAGRICASVAAAHSRRPGRRPPVGRNRARHHQYGH
jgi:acetyl-CoA C-acetyltransferase/acetyl-CoA acyltransferase